MKRIVIALCGALAVSASAVAEEVEPIWCLSTKAHPALARLKGPARTILEARQLSEVLYFFELPAPLQRGFTPDKDGSIAFTQARSLGIIRRVFRQKDDGSLFVVHERPVPSRKTREQVASVYRKVLAELAKARKAGRRHPAPFEFLGAVTSPPPSKASLDRRRYSIADVRRGYEARPSSLEALAYLELALLEKTLKRDAEYRRLLKRAVPALKLTKIDFRADVNFRAHLYESLNFARPETCLLFLVAEEARMAKQNKEARRHYKVLIERAPGSPFAWEALARMTVLRDADAGEIEGLAKQLLKTYPLVWGCERPGLKLKKDAFAAQLPALLKKVATEKKPRYDTIR